jgi:hypothetical protein
MSRVWMRIRALLLAESTAFNRAQGEAMPREPAGSGEISVAAGAPIGIRRRRNGNYDDAEREHGQSHEFEYKCVHDKIPPACREACRGRIDRFLIDRIWVTEWWTRS